MNYVIGDTRGGIAAIGPSVDTPAGQVQLVAYLQRQLQRAKALLVVSERRNIELAAMIRAAAAGYRFRPAVTPVRSVGTFCSGTPAGPAFCSGTAAAPAMADTRLPAMPSVAGQVTDAATIGHAGQVGEPAGSGPAAQTAVKAALSRLGRPYRWGGKGPDAFDCSGLVRWSWAQAGVTLAGDTYHQIDQGVAVAPGEVRAGDLIFPTDAFGEGGCPGPGHVMLAISPTECVEAQQSGVPVKISPMPAAFVARRPVAN